MRFFSFVAGFFRESGATESSTRLVGILSFLNALALSAYCVITKTTDASAIALVASNFTAGSVALGLRKGDGEPAAP